MKSLRWAAVLGLACAMVAGGRADDKADEVKKLEGTWVVKAATRDGRPVESLADGRLVMAAGRLTVKPKEGKEQEYTFQVDPAKKPKALDLAFVVKVPNASPGLVIYDLDGDNLKVVIGPPDARPTEFTDKNGQILVTLARKK